MRISMVVQEGCLGSAVGSIIDIVAVAESVRPDIDPSIPPLVLDIAAVRKHVETGSSMTLHATQALDEIHAADLVIVPAIGTFTGADTHEAVGSRAGQRITSALGQLDPARTSVAAACTGVFTLAASGHLDERRATTSWFLGADFRKTFPSVDLDLDTMVVVDGSIMTAGAAFAHIDLGLAVVRSVSADLATHVARLLLIDERPSQAAFVSYDHFEHDDPIVIEFERHVRATLDQPFDVAKAATTIGTSRRTLERRVRDALNLTPLGFVQRLRLERARHLSATTNLTTQDIALRVGYANAETLRSLMRRS